MRRKGFSLLEVLAVVVIIAILVTLALPRYGNYVKKAIVSSVQASISSCVADGVSQFLKNGTKTFSCVIPKANPSVVYVKLNDSGEIESIGTSNNPTGMSFSLTVRGRTVECFVNATLNIVECR